MSSLETLGQPRGGLQTSQIGLAVALGLMVGASTEWTALRLPFDLMPLSSAAGPWILVAFVVALPARRMRQALILATGALIALVAGFYAAQATRGWPADGHQVAFWCAMSVIVGPLIGLAAGWLRYASVTRRAAGAGIPGGMLTGEALHGLNQPTFLSPHAYWYVQLGIGTALSATLTLRHLWTRRARAAPIVAMSLTAFVTTTLATLAAYRIT